MTDSRVVIGMTGSSHSVTGQKGKRVRQFRSTGCLPMLISPEATGPAGGGGGGLLPVASLIEMVCGVGDVWSLGQYQGLHHGEKRAVAPSCCWMISKASCCRPCRNGM